MVLWRPDKYQLTLSGTRAIFDQSGNALAGNGTTAGTNYVTDFTINRTSDVPPAATPQTVSVPEGSAAQIVLAATDTQGNPLTYSIVTAPVDGTVSAIINGNTLTYTPVANFYGADSFTFRATDPDGESSQAAVSVTVTPVDQAPVAIAQSVSVIHDAPQVIVLGGTDAETPASQLTYTIATEPTHGTLVRVPGSADAFTYTPAAGYLGADSFSFTVTDTGNPPGNLSNAKTSTPATVSVAVVDPPPVGVADNYTTREGVVLTVPATQGVLANDTDSAGDTLTATLVTSVAHGTLVLSSNGSFTYTPAATFTGTDSFTYLPHGTYVAGAATTVTINVTAGVAAPPPPPPKHLPPAPGGTTLPPAPAAGGQSIGVVTETALVAAPQLPSPVVTSVPQLTVGVDIIANPAATTDPAAPVQPAPQPSLGQPVASDNVTLPVATFSAGTEVPAIPAAPAVAVTSAATALVVETEPSTAAVPAITVVIAPAAQSAASADVTPLVTMPQGSADDAPVPPIDFMPQATTVASPPVLWVDDTAALMAITDPIVLPNFTLPGDETSALMLPATPEISHLPQDFQAAVRRLTELPSAIITFVDPVTGQLVNPAFQPAMQPAKDQSWLLVDSDPDDNIGALSSRIRWDSHPT